MASFDSTIGIHREVRDTLALEVRRLRHNRTRYRDVAWSDYPYDTVIAYVFELGHDVFPKDKR